MDLSLVLLAEDAEPAGQDDRGAPIGTVVERSQETLQVFRRLLLDQSLRPVYGNARDDVDKMVDEYGRLKIWAEQTGATLHERGSLDDTLQSDQALRRDITGVLAQLQRQLAIGAFDMPGAACLQPRLASFGLSSLGPLTSWPALLYPSLIHSRSFGAL